MAVTLTGCPSWFVERIAKTLDQGRPAGWTPSAGGLLNDWPVSAQPALPGIVILRVVWIQGSGSRSPVAGVPLAGQENSDGEEKRKRKEDDSWRRTMVMLDDRGRWGLRRQSHR